MKAAARSRRSSSKDAASTSHPVADARTPYMLGTPSSLMSYAYGTSSRAQGRDSERNRATAPAAEPAAAVRALDSAAEDSRALISSRVTRLLSCSVSEGFPASSGMDGPPGVGSGGGGGGGEKAGRGPGRARGTGGGHRGTGPADRRTGASGGEGAQPWRGGRSG
ncbi:hypothetical protein GCM10009551_055530 [Nocardiopsis tropica]